MAPKGKPKVVQKKKAAARAVAKAKAKAKASPKKKSAPNRRRKQECGDDSEPNFLVRSLTAMVSRLSDEDRARLLANVDSYLSTGLRIGSLCSGSELQECLSLTEIVCFSSAK